ncbi:hypothetical protein F4824DRAFT_515825 [Ustulina deusta]|nr:hypothetical protein F4824DRAFT_515825 [Ustulina deusta]
MLEACNVINWMMSIQQYKGLFPIPPPNTRDKLPGFLIGPAVQTALRELDSMRVCKNRLWNIVEVSKRKQMNLPDIVMSLRSHTLIRHTDDHELCTQSKCQGAHLDSTAVRQLHKNPEGDNEKCSKGCTDYIYPVDLLVPALEKGGETGQTAWSRAERRLVPPGTSYIAISHVWSDGTGVGGKVHGHANSCLMDYFAAIAGHLQCDGIWWDTLCIPVDPNARSTALSKMHALYRHAKFTVVHDIYLAGLEWANPESACLALVLSPWFTRGWTALELAMSGDVKVIFKGSDPTKPDIRDLEVEILARDPSMASHTHWLASSVIRRLRSPIRSLSDLLAILRPRSTSWVRDRTLIASLLANVPDPDFTRKESEIIQQLIKHIGFVPHATLLHDRPTMTDSGGFSWCPATLDDLPIKVEETDDNDDRLTVQHDGSIVGYWCARPVSPTDMKKRRVQPYGSEVSVVAKFETALLDWSNCLLLYQELDSEGPALLVTTLQVSTSEDGDLVIDCRYVGAALDSRSRKRDIINISKFEGGPDFWRAKFKDSGFKEEDSDGDGDSDRNDFHMFSIRLGRDGGKKGARAWDLLREAWALRESSSDGSDEGLSDREIHPIWKLALGTGTPPHHWNDQQLIYDSAGASLLDDQADRLSSLLWKIISETFETSAAASKRYGGRSIPHEESMYDFVRKENRRTSEEMFVESDYSATLNKISKQAREQAKLLLQAEVVSLCTPERRLLGHKVELATGEGSESAAKKTVGVYGDSSMKDEDDDGHIYQSISLKVTIL